jgi:hypothetical protein
MSFFIDQPKQPTLAFNSFAEERNFAKAQVDSQAKAYQQEVDAETTKSGPPPEETETRTPAASASDRPGEIHSRQLEDALSSANLDDEDERFMLSDLLEEHGRQREAEHLRSHDGETPIMLHGGRVKHGARLHLWVDNQPEGVGHDTTSYYIRSAIRRGWKPPPGVNVEDDGVLTGEPNDVYAAYKSLAATIGEAGHGDGSIDLQLGPPQLTAVPHQVLNNDSDSSVQMARIYSRERPDWRSFAKAGNMSRWYPE